jgi:hypothetical protein
VTETHVTTTTSRSAQKGQPALAVSWPRLIQHLVATAYESMTYDECSGFVAGEGVLPSTDNGARVPTMFEKKSAVWARSGPYVESLR